jgi:bifunctional DNA-binding transcriptional regulator/antitoxin component of YhaV-PrlF toxin-antitoxin module
VISRNRQLTVPVAVAGEAELSPGDRLRVTAEGRGRVVLERIEEPGAKVPRLRLPG